MQDCYAPRGHMRSTMDVTGVFYRRVFNEKTN